MFTEKVKGETFFAIIECFGKRKVTPMEIVCYMLFEAPIIYFNCVPVYASSGDDANFCLRSCETKFEDA